ncbi:hypothetical protein [Streptomyces sp. NPDC058620]|uniref:hypothetical protein n=1 Tax=Streptomyces sp. NPDC058620 TaxID=3346560 RepID=UPI003655F97A
MGRGVGRPGRGGEPEGGGRGRGGTAPVGVGRTGAVHGRIGERLRSVVMSISDGDQHEEQDQGTDADAPISEPDTESGRLTPRQARHLRIALSSVGMAAMAVVLALRIASRSSVLVVGVYGLALILCGIVIELSRNGRTRLASWLLGTGLAAAVGADWLLIP